MTRLKVADGGEMILVWWLGEYFEYTVVDNRNGVVLLLVGLSGS
jgi:hypothetical protein